MGWLDNWRGPEAGLAPAPGPGELDLSQAVITAGATPRQATYVRLLVDEVRSRSRVELARTGSGPRIDLGVDPTVAPHPEGYAIHAHAGGVRVRGASERGLWFGIGRLLRECRLDHDQSYRTPLRCVFAVPTDLHIVSWPDHDMRQHQIAYRPKTHSYDAFTPAQMRQEITDQALFGCNGIELIGPGLDDAEQSPHFTVPWLTMLREASAWCDALDLRVSLWFPAFSSDPEPLWRAVFEALPRLDALFVPGGDPGGRPADELFAIVARQREVALACGHDCEVWVSSQYGLAVSVDLGLASWRPRQRLEEWLAALARPEVRAGLTGVVYGPWTAMPLAEFRARVPGDLPVRNYPDLCHTASCELPVQAWDPVFATAHLRETINPRPRTMAAVIADQAPHTTGCGCYSEGVGDDVHKVLWSVLHWGGDEVGPRPHEDLLATALHQYAATLLQLPRHAPAIARVLLDLEHTWDGPLDPDRAQHALALARRLEDLVAMLPARHQRGWRLSMLRFRASYDAFLVARYQRERAVCAAALHALPDLGAALRALDAPSDPTPVHACGGLDACAQPDDIHGFHARLQRLAGVLFGTIGYQTSVGLGAQHRQRGAFFDMAWIPVGDAAWLRRQLEAGQTHPAHLTGVEPDELWYASFGEGVVRGRQGIDEVVAPHRALARGEDPTCFAHPLVEHLATDDDAVLQHLVDGRVPRRWRSWLVAMWPTCGTLSFRFDLTQLDAVPSTVAVTWVGRDLNHLGGDWGECGRRALPTRLVVNGVPASEFLDPPERTSQVRFALPPVVGDTLEVTFEPPDLEDVAFTRVVVPIAELWLLR